MTRKKRNSKRNVDFLPINECMTKQKKQKILDLERLNKRANVNGPFTTLPQATQRMKFSLMSKFMTRIKDAIQTGFKNRFNSAVNTAIQLNCTRAALGAFPDVYIFYDVVTISQGNLGSIFFPQITLSKIGKGQLRWEVNEFDRMDTDKVYLLIYSSTREEVLFSGYAGIRSDKEVNFDLPQFHLHDELHAWIFMKSEDEKNTSDSEYVYELTLTD